MHVKNILKFSLVLACATCQREQETASPPAQPATSDATPAQELPSADSATAGGSAQPNADTSADPGRTAPGPASGQRSNATTSASASGAGGRAPSRPPTSNLPQQTKPAPAPTAQQDAIAGQDPGAAVLQRASTAYANLRALKSDFVMQYSNPLLRQQTTSRGTLYQRRPDRVALRFTDPVGDVILSDGQYYWIYYPSVDKQQVIRCPTSDGGEQGVDLQAQFVGDPVQRFRYTLHGEESVGGRTAHVLTLVPREQTDYRTLKVWLDTRDFLARRFEITELNGTVRRFDLSDFEVNVGIPDATFRFSPPANARIVSCR